MKRARILIACCECHKVIIGGSWYDESELPIPVKGVEFSHGYCPACLDRAMAALDAHFSSKEQPTVAA